MAPSWGGNSNSSHNSRKQTKQAPQKAPQKPSKASSRSTTNGQKDPAATSSHQHVQRLLNVFKAAFPALLEPNAAVNILPGVLQQVKHFLFERGFARAFGQADFLEAYAARWSASRCAGYSDIFLELLHEHVLLPDKEHERFNVVCLGGGSGAELAGFAGALSQIKGQLPAISIVTVDVADWTLVLDALYSSLTNTRDGSQLVEPANLTHAFSQQDLLQSLQPPTSLASANLVTLMFTLNELFTTSLSKTQALLLDITTATKPGAFLLVVDSPGSYSTVQLSGREKRYPMAWMLAHVLLNVAAAVEHDAHEAPMVDPGSSEDAVAGAAADSSIATVPKWEKLSEDRSRWFRLPKQIDYPIDLEDMHVQIYLYRRC